MSLKQNATEFEERVSSNLRPMNSKMKLWSQSPRPLIRCLTISSWSDLKRCELLRSRGTSTILKAAWMPSCRWEKETLPSFFVKKDTTMLEVFGSHLKVPPPGDGLWGEGWVEGGGEEGDHLHHRPGARDCKNHFIVISCQTSRFVFPELPQRGRREARRSDFAERWSVPPQHHRLLRLEHCAGGFASWNKQTWAIGLYKTLCRTTPAWATSTTWQRSTVWTWSGRWPGSTSTSTRGSHRSSSTSSSPTTTTSHGTHPDDLYQRGRPDLFRLEQCRGIGNSFDFHTW